MNKITTTDSVLPAHESNSISASIESRGESPRRDALSTSVDHRRRNLLRPPAQTPVDQRSNRRKTHPGFTLALALALFAFLPAQATANDGGFRLALVQSGYPGSSRAAKGFLETFSSYLMKKTSLEKVSATYDNVPKDALEKIAKAPPKVGVVSLGFYLKHRKKLGLRAHLEAVPAEKYYIVAQKGKVKSLDSLRHSAVAGGALYEPEYLHAIVFPAVASDEWKKEPTLRPTRALRKLTRGSYSALVINGREYRSFGSLGKLQGLETLAESKPLPMAVVVSFGATEDSKESPKVAEFVKALRGLKDDKDGTAILRTMNCEDFRPPVAEQLAALEKQFDARQKPVEKDAEKN